MSMNWKEILDRLQSYPAETHKILPPCPEKRISYVVEFLGRLPDLLIEMLRQFNGAELFIRHGPTITVFGISPIPLPPPLEWAPDWYIDKLTPSWRLRHGNVVEERRNDWVIGITNYGGLQILSPGDMVRQWDTATGRWDSEARTASEWIDAILREGEEFLKEI